MTDIVSRYTVKDILARAVYYCSSMHTRVGISVGFHRYQYNRHCFVSLVYKNFFIQDHTEDYILSMVHDIGMLETTDTNISVLPICADIGRYPISADTDMPTLIPT